ncbi:MAG: T9SS type A sorting domain-containing protein [Rhodothermales bacterium]|nr:T9SS type A sorting domain-containing protein [Rhodothermales bacterium]
MSHLDATRFRRVLTSVICFVFILFIPCASPVAGQEGSATRFSVDMTCFPPPPAPGGQPGVGPPPPCILPVGIAPEFVSPAPSGTARFNVRPDGTTRVAIELEGVDPELVITVWTSYYFPGGPAPHPIFAPIAPGKPAIAGVSAPLAPTSAGYTEGLGPEPNEFEINANGKAQLTVELDYNPLLPHTGPLRNDLVITNQTDAPAGSGVEQPLCCATSPTVQSVGASFLRHFDLETGFQQLVADGRPMLVRSPLPVAFLAVVVHVDKQTHGINPGVPILPIPGTPVTAGDHFLLGIFDLRPHFPESSAPQRVASRLPDAYILSGIYPNPFNPTTAFQLTLAESQRVRIEVFDLLGRSVAMIQDGVLGANEEHVFSFDAGRLASGRYVLRVLGETFETSRTLALAK